MHYTVPQNPATSKNAAYPLGLVNVLNAEEKYDLLILLVGSAGPDGIDHRDDLRKVVADELRNWMTALDWQPYNGRPDSPRLVHDLVSYQYSRATREGLLRPTPAMVKKNTVADPNGGTRRAELTPAGWSRFRDLVRDRIMRAVETKAAQYIIPAE